MDPFVARLAPRSLVVFLLHGVTDAPPGEVRNYTGKHVRVGAFRKLLTRLQAAGTAVSLEEVIACHAAAQPYPPRAFAITFDDGFANNYLLAAPILRDLAIPATFYVTTGWIGTNGMSWTDQLEYCLEHTPRGTVRLPWREDSVSFGDRDTKIALMNDIRYQVKRRRELDVAALVADFFAQCRQPLVTASDEPLDQKLTWAQVRALAGEKLFTVGGHTHTHATLAFLSPAGLAAELDTSLGLLAAQAGVGARHYSYPEGLDVSYSPAVIAALRERGVVCCPTAMDGVNDGTESLFDLRRVMVG